MYLATQSGLVSSATSTAAVTQYDNTVTEGPASPPDLASWGSPVQGTTSPAVSPEPGQQSGLHLTCNDVDNILRGAGGGEGKGEGCPFMCNSSSLEPVLPRCGAERYWQ